MKPWKLFAAGAGYGLAMRLLFGWNALFGAQAASVGAARQASGAMLSAFVLGVPLALGVFTAYGLRKTRPGFGAALFAPWLPTLCFVGGTALLLIEGSICIAMALPVFLALASVGGVLGWCFARLQGLPSGAVHSVLLLPLIAAPVEQRLPLADAIQSSEASVTIAAPPDAVWREINRATGIAPQEMAAGWAFRIGVPYPVEAVTAETPQGRVRKLRWQKDVHFDEPITAWEPERYIRWRYAFRPDSFPAGALDEHVLIGGTYFDLIHTSYRLTPVSRGTRLDIVVHYRVSTHFNWYAAHVGRWLVDDAAQAILHFYQHRLEARAG